MEVSRKSLLSLAQSSSSIPLSVSNESSSELSDFSVDEIFSKYSVAQVQKLQLEYKSNVARAKDDLHRLVGEKYRDLIRIAEDIEGMSAISQTVDSQLSDLSYKPSKYVPFGANPLSKFDSVLRNDRAKIARSRSGKTILNNVINNKLIGLDLKLKTNMLKRSSTLVFMAKLYYTIGVTFKQTLLESPHVSTNLLILKQNFVKHLEHKIATASTSSGTLLAESEIFSHKSKASYEDEFDVYDDAYGEDEEVEFSDSEDDEYVVKLATKFSSSSPMVNYIIAYIVVNRDNETLNSLKTIAERIVSLRLAYLRDRLLSALKAAKITATIKVDFFPIFTYIEMTCHFANKFFLSSDSSSNDLLKLLRRIPNWNASDLIGFHNWFEQEQISFNDKEYSLPIPAMQIELELSKFGPLVYEFAISCLERYIDLSDSYKSSQKALDLLHRFVGGLRHTEVLCLANLPECFTVNFLAKHDVTSRLLDFVLKKIIEVQAERHLNQLSLETHNSIAKKIQQEVEEGSFAGDIIHEPFTQSIFDLMDHKMNDYIKSVVQLSSPNRQLTGQLEEVNSEATLRNWFLESLSLLQLLSFTGESTPQKIYSLLDRQFKEVNGLSAAWGSFTKCHLKDVFTGLQKTVLKSALAQVSSFSSFVDNMVQSNLQLKDEGRTVFLLRILLVLKEYSQLTSSKELVPTIDQNITEICTGIFKSLLETQITGQKLFSEYIRNGTLLSSESDSGALPVRPHLGMNSTIYGLVQRLLDCPHFNRYEMCSMYLSASLKENFVATKNEWILRDVIPGILQSILVGDQYFVDESKNAEEASELPDSVDAARSEPADEEALKVNVEEDNWSEVDGEWADDDGWEETSTVKATKTKDVELDQEESGAEDKTKTQEFVNESTGEEANKKDPESTAEVLFETEVLREKRGACDYLIQKSRQCLANIVFMLNFTTNGEVSDKHEQVLIAVDNINRESAGALESSAVEYIVRNVNDFYKSSRQMFLPLLAN